MLLEPVDAPAWLKADPAVPTFRWFDTNNQGTHKASYCKPQSVPAFWSPEFVEYKAKLIRGLGFELADVPAVVGVMASFANVKTNDWNVPHEISYRCDTEPPVTVNNVASLLAAGCATSSCPTLVAIQN